MHDSFKRDDWVLFPADEDSEVLGVITEFEDHRHAIVRTPNGMTARVAIGQLKRFESPVGSGAS